MKASEGKQTRKEPARGIRMSRSVVTSKYKRGYDLLVNPHPSSRSCQLFAFLNPLLVAVLEVHTQNAKLSPFATHKSNMWVFLLATIIFCLAISYSKRYPKLASSVALITGSLGSVSILSIFLPHLLGKLSFVVWIFWSLYIARSLMMYVGQKVLQASKTALSKVRGDYNIGVMRTNITEKRRCCV